MPADSLAFARSARALASEARRRGLTAPAFRSPPGLVGADRTLRRQPGGGAVVAVRRRGRRLHAVVADLVDGVVAANGLSGPAAERVRASLWQAVCPDDVCPDDACADDVHPGSGRARREPLARRTTVDGGTWPNRQRQGA
jgi:hypothetical protein